MHHAPCTMLHAPCTMHHASRHFHPPQLRIVQSGFPGQEGRQDLMRTPRRRNPRDRDGGKNAGGSGRYRNPSRSRSPPKRTPQGSTYRHASPPPYQSPSKSQVFQPSTASQGLPVCALCLATDPTTPGSVAPTPSGTVPKPGATRATRGDSST